MSSLVVEESPGKRKASEISREEISSPPPIISEMSDVEIPSPPEITRKKVYDNFKRTSI